MSSVPTGGTERKFHELLSRNPNVAQGVIDRRGLLRLSRNIAQVLVIMNSRLGPSEAEKLVKRWTKAWGVRCSAQTACVERTIMEIALHALKGVDLTDIARNSSIVSYRSSHTAKEPAAASKYGLTQSHLLPHQPMPQEMILEVSPMDD